MVAALSRGQRIGRYEWRSWVRGLGIADDVKERLLNLTPEAYTGYAERLVDMALEEIADSRKNN